MQAISDTIDADLRHKWVFLFVAPLLLTIEGLMLSDALRLGVTKNEGEETTENA